MIRSLAIIPARGGSKRIKRKNIRDFLGKPIIAYSIEAAVNSRIFEEVMVSTDNAGIARVAKTYKASVPFMRSKVNSGDLANLTDVCLEVVKTYLNIGRNFDYVCCILPTAPFINKKMLIAARNMLCAGEYDCVFPIVEYAYPIQRAIIIKNNFVKMVRSRNIKKRSQDLEKSYHDAGQFYFIKTEVLLAERKLFCKRSGALMLNNMEAQDIDSETDWKIAEIKYSSIRRGKIS